MKAFWSVDELEIVGYADALSAEDLPATVPPVFHSRIDPEKYYLPPYSFSAGLLCDASEVLSAELLRLQQAEEITLFNHSLSARVNFELWLDQSFQPHYELREEARQHLNAIAEEALEKAEQALRDGALDEAESFAGTALSANDAQVNSLTIKAAICRFKNDGEGEQLMARLAAPILNPNSFKLLLDDYSNRIPHLAAAHR